jgi:hypothetical protein
MRTYHHLDHIDRDEFEKSILLDTAGRVNALVRLSLHHEDGDYIERACLDALQASDPAVARSALVGLGHKARLHHRIGPQVLEALEGLKKHAELAGSVADTLDDVAIFVIPS